MRFFLTFMTLAMLGFALAPSSAQAAGLYGYCDVIEQARDELPILNISTGCQGTLQDRLYGAVAAVSGGNSQSAAAQLGMLKVETGCGTNTNNATLQTCTGLYNASARSSNCPSCTASGATQITNATWQEIVTSTATRNAMLSKLGGCNYSSDSTPAGSLVDPSRTRDGIIRNQYVAFRNAMCGRGGNAVTDKNYWNSMVGVSVLAADAYDTTVVSRYNGNAALNNNLNSIGVNANAVTRYAGHNLGPGDGAKFLNAMSTNPNQSVANFLSSTVINNNPGLYCVGGRRPCTPVSVSQAARNMQNTMFSGSCVRNGMANMNMPITSSDLPVDGGIEAHCVSGPNDLSDGGVVCGTSGAAAAIDMGIDTRDLGGLAGAANENADYTQNGVSRFPDNTSAGKSAVGTFQSTPPSGPVTEPTIQACPQRAGNGSSASCTAPAQ